MRFERSRCGQKIEAELVDAGRQVQCPSCSETITIPNTQGGEMNNSTDVTKKVLNISISIAALAVAFWAVWSAVQVKRVADAASGYLTELQQQQVELKPNAERVSTVVSESLVYGLAVSLEQGKILSAYDAKKMREESLTNIKKQSERWGKIAEAVSISLEKEMLARERSAMPR